MALPIMRHVPVTECSSTLMRQGCRDDLLRHRDVAIPPPSFMLGRNRRSYMVCMKRPKCCGKARIADH